MNSITTHFGPRTSAPTGLTMSRAKNWCITLNNPVEECLGFNESTDDYLICGIEIAQSGTKHIQGYVQLKERMRLNQLKNRWPTAHLEIARGSPKRNVEYCSKDGHFRDHGELQAGQGSRSDLESIKNLIDGGFTERHIRNEHYGTYIRYQKALIRDIESMRPDRSWSTELHIYWGATGTGKSRKCREEYPDAYWKTRGNWWDGYDGHEVVIIDEFYGWLPFDFMLRLCDRYPFTVEVKGGVRRNLWPKKLLSPVTSPTETSMYMGMKSYGQLLKEE